MGKQTKRGSTYYHADPLAMKILSLRRQAQRRGLWKTMSALDNAAKEIVWEIADQFLAAKKAESEEA